MAALKMHDQDTVATVFDDRVEPGGPVEVHDQQGTVRTLEARTAVPYGHKIAVADIGPGDPVIKYGEVIGVATAAIRTGEHVHVHNLDSQRGRGDWSDGI